MSNEQKPREFWIEVNSVHGNVEPDGSLKPDTEKIHVIEHSAYEALRDKAFIQIVDLSEKCTNLGAELKNCRDASAIKEEKALEYKSERDHCASLLQVAAQQRDETIKGRDALKKQLKNAEKDIKWLNEACDEYKALADQNVWHKRYQEILDERDGLLVALSDCKEEVFGRDDVIAHLEKEIKHLDPKQSYEKSRMTVEEFKEKLQLIKFETSVQSDRIEQLLELLIKIQFYSHVDLEWMRFESERPEPGDLVEEQFQHDLNKLKEEDEQAQQDRGTADEEGATDNSPAPDAEDTQTDSE